VRHVAIEMSELDRLLKAEFGDWCVLVTANANEQLGRVRVQIQSQSGALF
jgi:hypothetical protein